MTETFISTEAYNELYAEIKKKGYEIDVRDVKPVLRRKQWARVFDTHEAALMFALDEIRKG